MLNLTAPQWQLPLYILSSGVGVVSAIPEMGCRDLRVQKWCAYVDDELRNASDFYEL
jgi:hypothetical protein